MLTDVREVGRAQNAGTCVTWGAEGGGLLSNCRAILQTGKGV